MTDFLIKSTCFGLILMLLIHVEPFFLLANGSYKTKVNGDEVYLSIEKSKQKSKCKTLVLGDSVGCQLFNNSEDHDSINSLACNQAIGIVGHYLLLNNYLNAGNQPEAVYLIYTPFSLDNQLDQKYTFHYFLKPFYTKEYTPLFSNTVNEQIDKIPFSFLTQTPYILTSDWSPNFRSKDEIDFTFLSPISKEFLTKIKDLCDVNGIEFHMLPTPTRISNKRAVIDLDRSEFEGLNTEKELSYFLDNIYYLADSLFLDNVHLREPEKYKKDMMQMISQVSTLKKETY